MMNKTKIKEHFKKYWWAYLLGIILIYAGYQVAVKKGLIGKKKGPTRPDIDNSMALGLSQGLWSDLDFQQPICIGESGEYVQALYTIMKSNQTYIARPASEPDINILGNPLINNFDSRLDAYIDYMVNGNGFGSSKSAGVTYSGCINLSDALKLGSAIIN
jgi:hypothetical protein